MLYLISNWFHFLFPITNLLCLGLAVIFFIDCLVLFRGSEPIKAQRLLPEKFSNSDLNELSVTIQNKYPFEITVTIIDEIPVQLQKRDFKKTFQIPAKSNQEYIYKLRPVERGEYVFGHLNVYVSSPIGIVKKRYRFEKDQMVKVYPSFIQMKKYSFLALDNLSLIHI